MSEFFVDRYKWIEREIGELARQAGRKPKDVILLVVSKQRPWSELTPLYACGQRHFGENRVQELLQKITERP